MTPDLQKYYEDRFSMFSTPGWKTLKEDAQRMLEHVQNINNIKDKNQFLQHKGMIEILNWILSQEVMFDAAYSELVEESKQKESLH